jgi:beta-lysine 5,6-aminomutase alpha subunit
LNAATALLEELDREGLFNALENGVFADIKRGRNGGKGLEGVVIKSDNYFNPFIAEFKRK